MPANRIRPKLRPSQRPERRAPRIHGINDPGLADAVVRNLRDRGCILCGRRVAAVGFWAPDQPAQLSMGVSPRVSPIMTSYGLCQEHRGKFAQVLPEIERALVERGRHDFGADPNRN